MSNARRIGLVVGPTLFLIMLIWSIVSQHPAGMYDPASGAAFITRLGLPARPGPDR